MQQGRGRELEGGRLWFRVLHHSNPSDFFFAKVDVICEVIRVITSQSDFFRVISFSHNHKIIKKESCQMRSWFLFPQLSNTWLPFQKLNMMMFWSVCRRVFALQRPGYLWCLWETSSRRVRAHNVRACVDVGGVSLCVRRMWTVYVHMYVCLCICERNLPVEHICACDIRVWVHTWEESSSVLHFCIVESVHTSALQEAMWTILDLISPPTQSVSALHMLLCAARARQPVCGSWRVSIAVFRWEFKWVY